MSDIRRYLVLSKPSVEILAHERVVAQLGVRATDSRNVLALPGRQPLRRVQTPDPRQQALASQHLVNAGNAARERVACVEDRAVGISERCGVAQPFAAEHASTRRAHAIEEAHRAARPQSPLAAQSADDMMRGGFATRNHREWREQIGDDAIVISRVERDILATRIGDGAHDVERLVAVEWSNLDGPRALDPGELAPEIVAQRASAHCRLQIESEQWQHLRDGAAVADQLRFARALQRAEPE